MRRAACAASLAACLLASSWAIAHAGPRHSASTKALPKSTTKDSQDERDAAPPPRATEKAASAAAAARLPAQGAEAVRIDRVRPMRDKLPTLRFLRENRDFIRGRFDRLRETPLSSSEQASEIDPRFLAYPRLLADAGAARDSVGMADTERQKHELLQSITQLGELEQSLDGLDRLLSEQRTRLAVLQADFTGDQRTELIVVVSGYPRDAAVSSLTLALEDGAPHDLPLTDEQREALRRGGALELFHGFVEPRSQVVQVGVSGDRWPSGDSGYLSLDPPRDRLLLLHLDLSTMTGQGAPAIRASTWLHDARIPSVDG